MTCPDDDKWDLLAMEALEDAQAAPLLAHARTCAACRARYGDARRAHIDRVRMYEAFDRDHDQRREQLMAALPEEAPQHFGAGRAILGWHRLGDLVMRFNTPFGRRAAAVGSMHDGDRQVRQRRAGVVGEDLRGAPLGDIAEQDVRVRGSRQTQRAF